MTTRAAKQLLRKEVKAKIAMLSDSEKLRQSKVVTEKLLASPLWAACKRLSVFLSMSDEIRTEEILCSALDANMECFIPRYVGAQMDMIKLHSWDDYLSLPETSWKIKQPPDDDKMRSSATETGGLDLLLVPGLAFTRSGQRLGRGKGYYDTYLQKYRSMAGLMPVSTVALAFYEQIFDAIPTTELDVNVDLVLFDDKDRSTLK